MNRRTVVRVLEAFFRHWPLYVAPLVIFSVYGLSTALTTTDEYASEGSLLINRSSFISDVTGVGGGLRSFLTPAQFTAQELRGLLGGEDFVAQILDGAGIERFGGESYSDEQINRTRAAIGVSSASENIVRVRVSHPDPGAAQSIAGATIQSYINFQIQDEVASPLDTLEFFEGSILPGAEEALRQAEADRDGALDDLPPVPQEELSAALQIQLESLEANVARAQSNLDAIRNSIETSELAQRQAATNVEQRIKVLDEPNLATSPISGFTDKVVQALAFTVVGFVLLLAGPIIVALLDRTVLFEEELARMVPAATIATIPHLPKRKIDVRRVSVAEVESSGSASAAGGSNDA